MLSGKGNVLSALNLFDEAILWYDKALNVKLDDVTLSNKGVSLVNLGKFKEALTCHDKALEINPTNATALRNKTIALKKLIDEG